MRAVADTGPLHYLVLIGAIDLLPQLCKAVTVPTTVRDELLRSGAPAAVRNWEARPPVWLTVSPTPTDDDTSLRALDDGERAVITLSRSLQPDLILMDDRAGVTAARAKGFIVMGTLGFLDRAAQHGLVDLPTALTALKATNFHIRRELLDFLLMQDRERRAR